MLQKIIGGFDLNTLKYLLLNFASSVGIILVNKTLYQQFGFKFSSLLLFFHSITAIIGSSVIAIFASSEYGKKLLGEQFHRDYKAIWIPWAELLKISGGNAFSIVFMNLSLFHNSVGFYQIAKLLTIPTSLILGFLFYAKTTTKITFISLIIIIIGVGITAATDIHMNLIGTIYALIGVFLTSYTQVISNDASFKLATPFQIFTATSPLFAVLTLATIPLFDPIDQIFTYNWSSKVIMTTVFSCLVSFTVNISTFTLVGITSPVSYQVLGHSKTVTVIFVGAMLFDTNLSIKILSGFFITLTGTVMYTYIRLMANANEKQQKQLEKEEDNDELNTTIEIHGDGREISGKNEVHDNEYHNRDHEDVKGSGDYDE